MIGVAISTTGDEHRLGFLETCVSAWRRVLPLGSVIVVTVDGDEGATRRAQAVVDRAGPSGHVGGVTVRVGQPDASVSAALPLNRLNNRVRWRKTGRLGVATNKNTGIEWLMDAGVTHLFLSDDDTWPLHEDALALHSDAGPHHSMVCWGQPRLDFVEGNTAAWTWPRGVMLYTHRSVVEAVGGMEEAFGPGGHEHVEWSQRIHRAGLTSAPFLSPALYARRTSIGPATRAAALWHCEDMRRPGEPHGDALRRKHRNTSVRREDGDWEKIEAVMKARAEDPNLFVPYRAVENGRGSATLYPSTKRSEEA